MLRAIRQLNADTKDRQEENSWIEENWSQNSLVYNLNIFLKP